MATSSATSARAWWRLGPGSRRQPRHRLRHLRGGARLGPDIAGKDVANPTALLQSAILMLRHLDEHAAADKVQKALESSIS